MVYIFLANGFEEIEALYTVDVLRRAGVDIRTVGVDSLQITGSHKIKLECDLCTKNLSFDGVEMVILPGGMPGSTNLDSNHKVSEALEYALKNDKYICAICAAPFILGKRNILNGKKATCFPGFENQLKGATITGLGCVRDGKIITARAMGSAHEFAFEILKALKGEETANRIKDSIILNTEK